MGKIWQNLPNNLDSIVSQELDTASIDLVKCSDSLGNMGRGKVWWWLEGGAVDLVWGIINFALQSKIS